MDAVYRFEDGEDISSVMALYRMARTTYYKWMALMKAGDGTLRSLHCRKASGNPCRLAQQQKLQVWRLIVGKDSQQYGSDFGLWTRAIVWDLILERWGISCSVEAVGGLLWKLELPSKRPRTRAFKRDLRAVWEWRRRRLPAFKREALAAGAEILFLDETGFRADAQMGRTWGAKGRTPVVERDGRRPSVNAIGMVSARGAFYREVFRGTFTSARFAGFLERFMKRRKGPVVIVLDNHPVHVSKAVVRLAERIEGRLRLEYLPAYAPELNPQEQAWRYAKRTGTSRNPLREGESISERAERDLEAMQKKPRLIRSFFEQPDTVYVHEAA